MTHASRNAILQTIEQVWGYSTFRPLQEEAIDAALQGKDSLVVLPTGGGKSLCYQVPPLIKHAYESIDNAALSDNESVSKQLDIVVSPLISLMKDQVDGLRANGYPAAAIYGGMDDDDRRHVAEKIQRGELRLLFVAPERLMNNRFLNYITDAGVRSFAIDEAHCISHWGHDFRPEYRRLAELRIRFPDAYFNAFTATATNRVQRDIVQQLHLHDPVILVGYFDRPNLVYRVTPRVDTKSQILSILNRHQGEAAIVYCISRVDTERLASYLSDNGIKAEAYHAGREPEDRKRIQDAFSHEQLNVVTATVAFGMGIDRSNVRCVVHAAMPKSVEHYQQETGRAGRDGLEAECVLLYSQSDVIRWEKLIEKSAQDANKPDDVIKAGKAMLAEMQKYASGVTCRHQYLVEYFDQSYESNTCAACDVCLDELDTVTDATTIAQKIISCVARVGQRFGVGHIADVLTGSKSAQIIRCKHDELGVHGLLSEMNKKEVANLTHQLLDQNYISRTEGDRPVLTLNDRSADVLRGQVEVQLVKPAVGATKTKFDAQSWEGVDRGLFEILKIKRLHIAEERNVPAYLIFNDASLRDMARKRPTSIDTFGYTYGVGEVKKQDLGDYFAAIIRDYCAKYNIDSDIDLQSSSERLSTRSADSIQDWKREIFKRFANGATTSDVMKQTGRKESTVTGYLVEYILHENPSSVDVWVDTQTYNRVNQAIGQVGLSYLKPIYESLDREVTYETIKVVAAHLKSVSSCSLA